MANGDDDKTQTSIQTPLGSVSFNGKRTAEFISILSLCALMIVGYALWEHKTDADNNATDIKILLKEVSNANRDAIQEMVRVQRANVEAQREMNCLISLPQDERRKEFTAANSLCKRLSRD